MIARSLLLLTLLALAVPIVGCAAGDVKEDSVKSQEADTAARIKAKGGAPAANTVNPD